MYFVAVTIMINMGSCYRCASRFVMANAGTLVVMAVSHTTMNRSNELLLRGHRHGITREHSNKQSRGNEALPLEDHAHEQTQ